MKKLMILLLVLTSCSEVGVQPIERAKGYVVAKKGYLLNGNVRITFKSKDKIFEMEVLKFDANKVKEGDTIK